MCVYVLGSRLEQLNSKILRLNCGRFNSSISVPFYDSFTPGNESSMSYSLLGTKVLENESSSYHDHYINN